MLVRLTMVGRLLRGAAVCAVLAGLSTGVLCQIVCAEQPQDGVARMAHCTKPTDGPALAAARGCADSAAVQLFSTELSGAARQWTDVLTPAFLTPVSADVRVPGAILLTPLGAGPPLPADRTTLLRI